MARYVDSYSFGIVIICCSLLVDAIFFFESAWLYIVYCPSLSVRRPFPFSSFSFNYSTIYTLNDDTTIRSCYAYPYFSILFLL